MKSYQSLEVALQHGGSKDVDGQELCAEVRSVSNRLPKSMTPQQVLSYMQQKKLDQSYPNLFVALIILLTLPLSVASGARSFSKLKLIKSYLRSTMIQDRHVGLVTLPIESELATSPNIKELASNFAKCKARKVPL